MTMLYDLGLAPRCQLAVHLAGNRNPTPDMTKTMKAYVRIYCIIPRGLGIQVALIINFGVWSMDEWWRNNKSLGLSHVWWRRSDLNSQLSGSHRGVGLHTGTQLGVPVCSKPQRPIKVQRVKMLSALHTKQDAHLGSMPEAPLLRLNWWDSHRTRHCRPEI